MTVGVEKSSMQKLAGAIDYLIGRVGFPAIPNTGDRLVFSEKRPSIFRERTVMKDGGGVNQLASQNLSPNIGGQSSASPLMLAVSWGQSPCLD